jgi:hypothetical protein
VNEQDKIQLSEEFTIKPFQTGQRTMNKWPQIRVDETTDLQKIIPLIKTSHNESQPSL